MDFYSEKETIVCPRDFSKCFYEIKQHRILTQTNGDIYMKNTLSCLTFRRQNFERLLFRLFTGIIVLLLNAAWQCNAQDAQSRIGKDPDIVETDSQNAYAITKDTFPKGRIGIKPPPNTRKENCLFVFYDKNGNVSKEITDKDLPAYSKFKSLDLPRIREQGGEPIKEEKGGLIKYNLRGLAFAKRKEVLQKAGVTGVPDSVIRRATDITYFGNPVQFRDGYGCTYIVTAEVSRFLDEEARYPIYTCFYQTHISIFDSTGNVARQLDVNHAVDDALISDDGRYLLAMFHTPHLNDGPTYEVPPQIFDFKTNEADTIDLRKTLKEERYSYGLMSLYMQYADSFFQVLFDGNIHLLINPSERKIYMKSYDEKSIRYSKRDYGIPKGDKINLKEYETKTY